MFSQPSADICARVWIKVVVMRVVFFVCENEPAAVLVGIVEEGLHANVPDYFLCLLVMGGIEGECDY